MPCLFYLFICLFFAQISSASSLIFCFSMSPGLLILQPLPPVEPFTVVYKTERATFDGESKVPLASASRFSFHTTSSFIAAPLPLSVYFLTLASLQMKNSNNKKHRHNCRKHLFSQRTHCKLILTFE